MFCAAPDHTKFVAVGVDPPDRVIVLLVAELWSMVPLNVMVTYALVGTAPLPDAPQVLLPGDVEMTTGGEALELPLEAVWKEMYWSPLVAMVWPVVLLTLLDPLT